MRRNDLKKKKKKKRNLEIRSCTPYQYNGRGAAVVDRSTRLRHSKAGSFSMVTRMSRCLYTWKLTIPQVEASKSTKSTHKGASPLSLSAPLRPRFSPPSQTSNTKIQISNFLVVHDRPRRIRSHVYFVI